jgi:phosphate transport system substrate-binding protein
MLFGPGADSGTFDYFTEAINGKAKASRGDYTASEDDNTLVQGVINNKERIGLLRLRVLPLEQGQDDGRRGRRGKGACCQPRARLGRFVQPAVAAAVLVRARHAMQRPEVKEFVTFMLTKGGPLVSEVGYLRCRQGLPARAEACERRQARFRVRRCARSGRHDRRPARREGKL